ncbi:MAG: DHHA1 domain-containing protein, partial [Candidatus Thermoplasmatota archaeon]
GLTIKEALRDSVEPCFKEFFAKEKEVENFLKKIKLDGDTAMSELKGEKLTSLVSILLLKLIEQNVPNLIAEEIYKKKYYLVKNGIEAEEFVKIVDGCCRMDREELGFEFCLSSQESMNEAMRIRKEYRENIRREIKRLISEGAKEMENIQYFYTAKPSFGGNLTSICMNYIFNKKKPTLCLSQVGNNLKISARGTKELVLMGLNLSDGCRVAASEAKGYGGGHPVAAGATIPFEMEKKFLDTLNKIVGKQIGKNEEI